MTSERLSVGLHSVGESSAGLVQRLATKLADWRQRAHARRALLRLDSRALHDLGLSDADVWRESRKRPWQA